jgi:methylmalonyl-CoA/ethylmalonyl-CoA epimerase
MDPLQAQKGTDGGTEFQTWQDHMSNEPLEVPVTRDDLKLHHIGFVVSSIEESAQSFALSLGAIWDGNIVFDPLQKVCVTFFQGHNGADPLIELVEPSGPESPVSQFLKRGGGLHHLCYEVKDLDSHLRSCQSVGTMIIRPPVPAVAFGGRRIAWGVTKKRLLMEFLEC